MVGVSNKVLADAKQKLNEMSTGWRFGVCRGTCLYLDGTEMITPHHNCHSWVGYAYAKARGKGESKYDTTWSPKYGKDAKQFLVLSCHSKKYSKSVSGEAMDAIILWMARESPFSKFVLNRDDDDSLLRGGVILLCGPGALTQAQAMWVCKVLRYSTEGEKALDTWLTLYKGGVNPLLAILVCSYVRTIKGATFGFTGTNGHSAVFGAYGEETNVASLLEGKINPEATRTADVFCDGTRPKNGKEVPSVVIKGFCKHYLKNDGWGGEISGEGADGPGFVKKVLEWQLKVEGVTTSPSPPPKDSAYLDLDL